MRAAARLLGLFSPSLPQKPLITIIEGRSRLGGRLTQDYLPRTEYLVDLGPNWIHGTDHNPILDIARELEDTTNSFGEDEKSAICDEQGKLVDTAEGKDVAEGMWGVIAQASKERYVVHRYKSCRAETCRCSNEKFANNSIDERKSLYDYFKEKVPGMWEDEQAEVRNRKRKMCLQFARMWGAFVGGPVEKQSLKFFWLEECLEGGMRFYEHLCYLRCDNIDNSQKTSSSPRHTGISSHG